MIVLIVKSIFKAYYVANAIPEGLNNFLKNFRVGIERVDENGLPTSYYLFEILIMLFVVIHIISLMLQGLWDKREVEIEAIDEAAVRVNRNKKTKVKSPRPIRIGKKKNVQRSASEDLHYAINASEDSSSEESKINDKRPTFEVASESPIKECGNPFKGRFENTIASRWRNFQSPIVYDMDLHHYDRQNAPNKMSYMETPRALTEYPYEEITFEEAQRFIDEEFSNTGLIQNYFTQTKRKLFKNNYFKRLFPIVSSQKPGRDFYAQMALVQFLCIIFIILFFTFMERDYTNITSQQLQVRQFSALLVVAVFLQIFFMLVDRYIYIAKSFSISKRASDDDDDIIDSTLAR